ncbi:MAG: hypothetical protein EXQ63_07335 [Ilumatobacteraceae bacterium]|nr:hypothetical protein [Ilumatobacteraceae bacterium]
MAMGILTTIFSLCAATCGAVLLVLVFLDFRKTRIDDGISAFRRHIDALSPQARRDSIVRHDDDSNMGRSK